MFRLKPNVRRLQAHHDTRGLLRVLHYTRDRSVQRAAAMALTHGHDNSILPEVIDQLLKVLDTSDNELGLQQAVMYALSVLPSNRAVEALFLCLNKPDMALRRQAAFQISSAFELGRPNVSTILEMGPTAIEPLLSIVYNFQAAGDLAAREAVQDIVLRSLAAQLHPCRLHFGDRIVQFLEDTILKFEYSLFWSAEKGGLVNLVPTCCRLLFAFGNSRVLKTVMKGIMRCDLIHLQSLIVIETTMRNEGYDTEYIRKKEDEWEGFKQSIRLAAKADGLDTNQYDEMLAQNQQKRFSTNMLGQYGVANP
jgi:hypothetical protein